MYLFERQGYGERERLRALHAGSLPRWPQQSLLGRAEGRSLDSIRVSCEAAEAPALDRLPLLSQKHSEGAALEVGQPGWKLGLL